jgi:hypothetical protein
MNIYPNDASKMKNADIIITTGTFEVGTRFFEDEFARVLVDEAHLLHGASMFYINSVNDLCSQRQRCVTATPCESSMSDLRHQPNFLGRNTSVDEALTNCLENKTSFWSAVNTLKKAMSRHTKDHSKALALPESTTMSVSINMDAKDRQLYKEGVMSISRDTLQSMRKEGSKPSLFEYH